MTSRQESRVPLAIQTWLQSLLRERLHDALHLALDAGGHWVIFLEEDRQKIHIPCDFEVFLGDPLRLPCGHWLPREASGWLPAGCVGLPTPGCAQAPQEIVSEGPHGSTLNYDMLSLTYWMLSRHEEIARADLDPHCRFPAEASHAFRHGYLERPIVDEWLLVLRKVVHVLWPALPLRQPRYTLQLSHDVDTPARYALISGSRLLRNMVVDLIRERQRDRRALLMAPAIWRKSAQQIDERDPFNTFDWIMDRSEQLGLSNAFYFLCGRTDRRRDGLYEADHPAIVALMQRIHKRGHEIGLHPSYNTFLDAQGLRKEAMRLRTICTAAGIHQPEYGVRMHYLRWQTPDTMRGLDAAGFAYDSTLGYAKHPGFRCGTCHDYQAFDPVLGQALTMRLRPLIVMESTVIAGMRPKDTAAAEARLLRMMEACHRVSGCFTLLWHNTMLEYPHQRRVYERVLSRHRDLVQICPIRMAA